MPARNKKKHVAYQPTSGRNQNKGHMQSNRNTRQNRSELDAMIKKNAPKKSMDTERLLQALSVDMYEMEGELEDIEEVVTDVEMPVAEPKGKEIREPEEAEVQKAAAPEKKEEKAPGRNRMQRNTKPVVQMEEPAKKPGRQPKKETVSLVTEEILEETSVEKKTAAPVKKEKVAKKEKPEIEKVEVLEEDVKEEAVKEVAVIPEVVNIPAVLMNRESILLYTDQLFRINKKNKKTSKNALRRLL